ncbi:zinc finger protein 638-like [Entelurus aequoreus]|uniref:zinc finger protein 638-like n=1 Tax=Entelurus aequoreus TaxID=161455 RepID=UPI002B1DE7D5|nr:zinc finger protein 638-like [Entelurus aequoreus]XP_061889485.1 zinc finger protein 638-like [Entelurus aequoreus]
MYHHRSQSQDQQSFPSVSRLGQNQQTHLQHNSPASNMHGFPFPRRTQLPDELESALSIRGARDTDHRLSDHTNQQSQHQGKRQVSIVSQHGGYSSSPIAHSSDNQANQQRADWSSFQPPNKLFASPTSGGSHHSHHPGPHQQSQSNQTGTTIPSWTSGNMSSSQVQRLCRVGAQGQGLYTPENAGSILASFGLSNDDLEVLSHYPDDQLTPDTLPFILRDIQINKSDNQNTVAPNIHDKLLLPTTSSQLKGSSSPEVPSLLTVTKTAGQVIDYGHASRVKDSTTTKTFKREKLSSARKVQMYPSSSSTSTSKVEKVEKRQVRLVHVESSRHGDRDYRRTSSDHHKRSRSRSSDGPPSKSRIADKDYRHNGSKPRFSAEPKNELPSRHSSSSSSGTASQDTSKKLPTSALISDFSGTCPKVFPHSCTLCHIECDHEKDWFDHVNTVNHTAACRDLRNKYPEWKLDRKSPTHSASGLEPPSHKPGWSYSHNDRYHYFAGGGSSQSGLKRPYNDLNKQSDTSLKFSNSKADHGRSHFSANTDKKATRPGNKTTKTAPTKADEHSTKPPPAKKKNTSTSALSDSIEERLVYLTGIPKQTTEQEVTKLVASFGKINNVILIPCFEKESDTLKASVCMEKAADAQALANSANIKIGDQLITASVAKKSEPGQSPVCSNSKPISSLDKVADRKDLTVDANQNILAKKGLVLITGLPGCDCSESDIIELIQPFGHPTDIILASSVRKVLVSLPDVATAQEVVKVHSSTPAKMKDCELKMVNIKQHIGIDTPVALYNLLMESLDPLESSVPVGWNSLLVISNVPNTSTSSSDVKQLVERFGTVVKSLELKNMVICEMTTAPMALSVYKRFQRFPCVIQSNHLLFSRKPDPKASTRTQICSPNLHSPKDILERDDCKSGANNQEAKGNEENYSLKKNKQGPEMLNSPEKVVSEDEEMAKNGSKIVTNTDQVPYSAYEADRLSKTNKVNIPAIQADMKTNKELSVEADMKTNKKMSALETDKEIPTIETYMKTVKEMSIETDMKTDKDISAIKTDTKTEMDTSAIETDMKTDKDMSAIETDMKTDKDMSAIETDTRTDKDMSAIETDTKTEMDTSAIETDMKMDKDMSAIETDTRTDKDMSVIETDTKTDKEMSAIETDTKTDKEMSAIETDTKTDKEMSAIEADTKTDKEMSAIKTDTKTEMDTSAIETDTRTDKDMSAIETDTRTDKDMSAIETDIRMDKDMSTIKTDTKTDKEMSAIEADMKTDNEMSAIETYTKTDKEMSAIKTDTKTDKEMSATETDTKTDKDMSAIKIDLKTDKEMFVIDTHRPTIETDIKTEKKMSDVETDMNTDKKMSDIETDMKTDTEMTVIDTNMSTIETDMKADKTVTTIKTVMQTTINETKLGEEISTDMAIAELTKDAQKAKDTGKRTGGLSNKMAISADGDQTHLESEREKADDETKETRRKRAVDVTNESVKSHIEPALRTQDRVRIEREARREKEAKERERREKERRLWEKERRAKWENEREERIMRHRRERERRDRKRDRDDRSLELRSSYRSETHKTSSFDKPATSRKSDAKPPEMGMDGDFDSFPFNMSEFVTVDEVGDVIDFPNSPPAAAPEDTTKQEQQDSPTCVPQSALEDTPLEITEGMLICQPVKSDDPLTECQHQPIKSDEPITDCQHQFGDSISGCEDPPTFSAETNLSSDVMGMLSCETAAPPTEAQQEISPFDPNLVPACQPEECETDGPTTEMGMTAEIKAAEGKEDKTATLDSSPGKESVTMMLNKEEEKMQKTEDKETSIPSQEPVKHEVSENPTITEKKSDIETPTTTDNALHFDPSNPVGMEFLMPKTGFFCKVCNRFFSGNKDAQITHCKTFKHFENLQKHLERNKKVDATSS